MPLNILKKVEKLPLTLFKLKEIKNQIIPLKLLIQVVECLKNF